MKNAIKKEIRKQVKTVGSRIGTVKHAISIQFPSANWDDFRLSRKAKSVKN